MRAIWHVRHRRRSDSDIVTADRFGTRRTILMITTVACAALASIGVLTVPAAADGGEWSGPSVIKNGQGKCMTAANTGTSLGKYGSGAVMFIDCHGGNSQKWRLYHWLKSNDDVDTSGTYITNVWTGWYLRWWGPGKPVTLVNSADFSPAKDVMHFSWGIQSNWIEAGPDGWRPSKVSHNTVWGRNYHCYYRDWILDSDPQAKVAGGYTYLAEVRGPTRTTLFTRPKCGAYPKLPGNGDQELSISAA